ncbi:MAG: hypothetical protein WC326_13855 [Candidatus Delongbacteria bacterium]
MYPHSRSPRRTVRPLAGALLLLALGTPAQALVWGLKTHDPVSGPPALLFWLDEATGGWGPVAPVTVAGAQVDADGLAQDPQGRLFAWRVESGGSTLLQLDSATAAGTPVGARLEGLDVRGATFLLSGRLLVFESAGSALLEIDPLSGQPLGAPMPVRGLEPGGAFLTGDLCQDLDGSLLFALGGEVSRLDPRSGRRTLLFNDTANLEDGLPPWSVGLALSPLAPADGALHLLDVSHHDALYRYASSSDFTRSLLVGHVVPEYNAGRGDLAALPAARTEITALRVADGVAELDAWCRAGCWVRVEYTPGLAPPTWSEVPGSLRQVPAPGPGIGTFCQWDNLPAPGAQGFWRVLSSREDPR